jgi:hypothetical protein
MSTTDIFPLYQSFYFDTHLKTRTDCVENPDPELEQAHKCGRVKSINGIPTLPLWIVTFPTIIQK